MSSIDDELAEIESQGAYGTSLNYGTAKASSPRATGSGTRGTGQVAPSAGTATTSSGVTKIKASQLKSSQRGRRGSGDFRPEDAANGSSAPVGAGGGGAKGPSGKLPMSAYVNPNMTAQQQAALQAMLERNPGLAKYAPPGALAGPTGSAPRAGGASNPPSHRMGEGGSPSTRKMGGGAGGIAPSSTKAGGAAHEGRGADLLVGWGQDGGEESDEDVYKPPTSKKMGQAASTSTKFGATPREAIGSVQPKAAQTRPETDKRKAAGDKDDNSDEEGGISYRPTVDAMARGGEAERIMRKQNEMYDLQMPAHRTYVGGFAAAAYETAREYHYIQKAEQAEEASLRKAQIKDRRPPPSI